MKKLTSLFLFLFVVFCHSMQAQNHEKLRRADCFFGVHFDLHASEDITNAGESITPAMIDTFLTKVRPDFIQIDCKGHPGISSYPTKAGNHVKGFAKDPLKLWREVTEKNKVGLYMHYSGVWDDKAASEHPDWAIVKASGERSKQKMSFFSPYLDKLMIPQLKELSSEYRVDGAWIDGECWAVEPDYSDEAIQAWKQKSGIQEVPRKRDDRLFPEYLEFTRGLFREHLKKYIDVIHAFDPTFQITSNWSYSSMMPEPVDINVDFISGDVTPQNGVFRSAFEARCIAPQGKPWDLMAWGFSWNGDKMPMSNKSAVQLKQEAAQIMAMGGGVQFYYQQNRDLSLKPWLAGTLSELGAFCRERQAFCHKAKAVPQVALFYPAKAYQLAAGSAFSGPPAKFPATLYALLDNQYSVEILMEHHLSGKMNQYPMIVVPECNFINPNMLNEFRNYLQNGGKLLIVGPETATIFARELGISSANTSEEKVAFIDAANRLGSIRSPLFEVKLANDAKATTFFYNTGDYRDVSKTPAASIRKVGKGMIAGIYFNAGSSYNQFKTPVIRDFVAEVVKQLAPEKKVEISGSQLVHVAVNELKGKTLINLINVAGEHTNQSAIGYDQVPALTNLTVLIKGKPSKVILQPEGTELQTTFANGKTLVQLPRLEIHSILELVE